MGLIHAFCIALSAYSRIPVPQVSWSERGMRYSICFFPVIGAVIGGVLIGIEALFDYLGLSRLFFAAVAAAMPTLITGGIHIDGFCDTSDALASHQPMERKLEILKDSSVGAFAVIKLCVYYLLYFGAFTQISGRAVYVVAIGYVLSRALSGLALMTFRAARKNGFAASFRDSAAKRAVVITMCAYIALSVCGMILISPVCGAVCALAAGAVFLYYRLMSYKLFGGVTGDIAGYFLSLCELWIALAAAVIIGVTGTWN